MSGTDKTESFKCVKIESGKKLQYSTDRKSFGSVSLK